MKNFHSDPFLARIRDIVVDSVADQSRNGFKSAVVLEVQNYSQLIYEQQEVSRLFLKICDLLLDCESKSIPDNSFKVLIANLVYEHSYSRIPSDREIRELTGMSASELSQAGEGLKGRECLVPVLRNNSIMNQAGKAQKGSTIERRFERRWK